MKNLIAIGTIVSLLILTTCSQESKQSSYSNETDIKAVEHLIAEFDRCAREGDLETFLSYSMDDVVSLAPNEPAIVGKDVMRTWYENFYATFDIEMKHEPIETHSFGDAVIHRGNATGTITPKVGGEPLHFNNKYLFVLRRQTDGSLKVWRAVFNSNTPPPQIDK